jgi:hypothetical protein
MYVKNFTNNDPLKTVFRVQNKKNATIATRIRRVFLKSESFIFSNTHTVTMQIKFRQQHFNV